MVFSEQPYLEFFEPYKAAAGDFEVEIGWSGHNDTLVALIYQSDESDGVRQQVHVLGEDYQAYYRLDFLLCDLNDWLRDHGVDESISVPEIEAICIEKGLYPLISIDDGRA